MKTKTSKRQSQIPPLVERGYAIHQQLSVLNDEFKKIKERLKDEAVARPAEHLPLLERTAREHSGSPWARVANAALFFPRPKSNLILIPVNRTSSRFGLWPAIISNRCFARSRFIGSSTERLFVVR
ncbi:MAG: hypothetical protein WDO13_00305 [Verrucomicrobiota bacterium]